MITEGIATLPELRSRTWTAIDVERAHRALQYKAAAESLIQREAERRAQSEVKL